MSIPERRYGALGEVLTQAIAADGPTGRAWGAAQRLAHDRGQALGERVRGQRRLGRLGPEGALGITGELLGACGDEPARTTTHQLMLRTCPFQRVAGRARELVCALNQDFLAGLLHGLGARRVDAIPQPDAATDPTRCCVLVRASSRPIRTP